MDIKRFERFSELVAMVWRFFTGTVASFRPKSQLGFARNMHPHWCTDRHMYRALSVIAKEMIPIILYLRVAEQLASRYWTGKWVCKRSVWEIVCNSYCLQFTIWTWLHDNLCSQSIKPNVQRHFSCSKPPHSVVNRFHSWCTVSCLSRDIMEQNKSNYDVLKTMITIAKAAAGVAQRIKNATTGESESLALYCQRILIRDG